MPAAFSTMAGKMWLVEPSVAPTADLAGPRLGVGHELLPRSFHGVFGLEVSTDGVAASRQIGSKSVYFTSAMPA